MTMANSASTQVCRLEVRGAEHLAIAGATVSEAATVLGVDSADAAALRCVAQELAAVVVAHAFEPGDEVVVAVAVERRPGGVAVVVSDQGAPSHLTRTNAHPPRLAELIRLGFADELGFSSQGREGNNAELFKSLRYRDLRDDDDFQESADDLVGPAEGVTPEVEIRELRTTDTIDVARLFHRCYGYTAYQNAFVYEPARLAEYIEARRHRGTVALVDGRLVGHVASAVDRDDATTGYVGMLVVDPAYRQYKIAGQLTFAHGMRMLEEGFIGAHGSAVTAHTASQKITLKFGGHEVALLVAEQQPDIEFKAIGDTGEPAPDGAVDEAPNELRRSNVWFYTGMGKEPEREVHVPAAYREIVETLYENATLPRTLADATTRLPQDVPEHSRLDLQLKHEAGVAIIKAVEFGRDFVAALQHQLNQLRLNRFDVVRLVMPMSNSLTAYFGAGLQELGFFFCGVFPEMENGDLLVLQYLNNVEVDQDEILVASEFGEKLRSFVLADRAATQRNADNRIRSRAHMTRIYEALQ